MSIANELEELNIQRNDLAVNLTTKGVTASSSETLAQLVPKVLDIPTSSGAVSPKAVNFYDYDHTLVASWTLAELASATALPANPTHAGLTSQGWNYTLVQLKTENRSMNVGQMYITDDGKTRLYIKIATLGRMTVPLYWSQTVASGVTVDWGDGSATQTFTGTGNKNTTHAYASIGDYVITLEVTAGELGLGNGTSTYGVLGALSTEGRVYSNMLQKVEVGSGISSIGTSAFENCSSLASVVIPTGVTSIDNQAFQNCSSLVSVVIPAGVTSINSYMFNSCYSLASVVIPAGVTSIDDGAFSGCFSLASMVIPEGVTSINSYVFNGCYSLASVVIPTSMTSIPYMMFTSCYSLASVVIPTSVTSIDGDAFSSCWSLASVVIPAGVTSIGMYAFYDCTGVAEYHLMPTTPPTLGSADTFTNIPSDCVIYVPLASLATYQAATNWSTYASQMVGE